MAKFVESDLARALKISLFLQARLVFMSEKMCFVL